MVFLVVKNNWKTIFVVVKIKGKKGGKRKKGRYFEF
jgi:hypothetical protein|tara:strand:- start:18227 stop:18334 length:108 start_codon:yes stop_codon:yes gene_type:complete